MSQPKNNFAKIERNMKFVKALEEQLESLENRAASQRVVEAEAFGIRTAITQIRKVINEHVE